MVMDTTHAVGTTGLIDQLKTQGVRFVRLQYSDLHGISRGKLIPISEFAHVVEHGVTFAGAVMTCDLRHNTIAGMENGIPDMLAVPDVSTIVQVPWKPEEAWCVANLLSLSTHCPYPVDGRDVLRRVVSRYQAIRLTPVVGPELEFYLARRNENGTIEKYVNYDSHVYTVGPVSDPDGILPTLLEACVGMNLHATAANHEYGRGQYEINMLHSEALNAADRAFRFKTVVKELSLRNGLLATFMGKPWNDDEGSGLHLHLSVADADGQNAFYNAAEVNEVSRLMEYFVAGILHRAPSLMALLNPTVNAYRRINMKSLAPSRVNWGFDNRFTLIRIPNERGRATRVELRVGDGTANPYLAYAAVLLAGLYGMEHELTPPSPITGFLYELPESEQGAPLPTSLPEAIKEFEQDEWLRDELGAELVDSFLVVKHAEVERYQQWASDWEIQEYSYHL